MFHVPILRLRLGNMLLLLLLLSCVPHWTCVTRRFSFFAYQLTLISLFVDEGKWERNGKFMRTHCCCCCCCCFKWCGWGWPFYLNGILMRKDCTIVCLFFTYTGAVLAERHTWHYRQISKGRFHHKQASSVFVDGWSGGGWGGRKKEQDEDWHKSACGARPPSLSVDMQRTSRNYFYCRHCRGGRDTNNIPMRRIGYLYVLT